MSCTEPRKQTHPVWVLKTLLDIIKADDDRQLVADRRDLEPRNMRARVCVRVRKRKGVFVGTLPPTIKDIQRVLKCLILGHIFTEDRQNFFQGCILMMLQNSIDKLFTGGTNELLSEVLLCLFFVF